MPDERELDPPPMGSAAKIETLPRSQRYLASFRAVWQWLKTAGSLFSDINGTVWAASFSYYAFFALVPLAVLLVTLTTDFAARFIGEEAAQAKAYQYIVANVPLGGQARDLLSSTLHGVLQARGKIGFVALVGVLWSSLGFFQSLVSSVNQAFREQPLNWWKLPLRNLTMLGVLVSALFLGNVFPLVLKTAQGYLTFSRVWVPLLFTGLGYVVSAAVLFYGFVLFYKLAPRRATGVTFKGVWLPALLVTLLLQIAQQLFVVYSTRITDFNAVYGAFGGVIALMLWTYLCGMIVVFGGCLCAARYHPDDRSKQDAGTLASNA